MNKKELDKKFKFAGCNGICSTCVYLNICDKILPGYNKSGKCGGPFYKDNIIEEKID